MSSFTSTAQHKPVIVRTPSFGDGVVSERRPDGISVVQLPWGKVYLDQQNVGQVISSQYKRSRGGEEERDDADEEQRETRNTRRKRDSQHPQQPPHMQQHVDLAQQPQLLLRRQLSQTPFVFTPLETLHCSEQNTFMA